MTRDIHALRRRIAHPVRTATRRLIAPYVASLRNELERETQTMTRELDALRAALHDLRTELEDVDARQWDQVAISRRLAELEDSLVRTDDSD